MRNDSWNRILDFLTLYIYILCLIFLIYDQSDNLLLRQNRNMFQSKTLKLAEESDQFKLFDSYYNYHFLAIYKNVYQT